jgi:soluble cytochrome b562
MRRSTRLPGVCTNRIALVGSVRVGSDEAYLPIPLIYKMKKSLLFLTALFALALNPAVGAEESETELGAKMEKISSAWRVAKRQLADPNKNADTLTKLASVKENMTAALDLEPEIKKEKPAAEQAKFVADYKAAMKDEIKKVDEIIALVKAGKNTEAAKLVSVVDQDQKDAHKKFKKQKKKS